MINSLKEKYGNKCSGINVNGISPKINEPSVDLKFCEAVSYSFSLPLQITKKNVECPGAKRSLGYSKADKKLIEIVSRNTKISKTFIRKAIHHIPVISQKINHINLGITEEMERIIKPDIFIMYVSPSTITNIILLLARNKTRLKISNYLFLSVCGNVFANSYINRSISVSFGCMESRKCGGLDDNEVALGIPGEYIELFI
jgi:uncharacterized protein (DUF169 family)